MTLERRFWAIVAKKKRVNKKVIEKILSRVSEIFKVSISQ
jgi:hypothetical protein